MAGAVATADVGLRLIAASFKKGKKNQGGEKKIE